MEEEKLDTIYIELLVQACQMDPTNIWMQGSLEIHVNTQKPYEDSDIVMADALIESMKKEGTYFIFSCCCGMPDCSGWEKGVEVIHEENTIIWNLLDHNKSFRFERKRMETDIEEAKEEVEIFKAYFAEKNIKYVGFGCNENFTINE